MTSAEFCDSTGLTPRELQKWLDAGLLEPADMVGRTAGGGLRREFTAGQAERARLIKALQAKGAKLSELARANLALDDQGFVVFDGNELRTCRDAVTAIATVVKAKRPCSAVDLSAIRTDAAATESSR